MSLQAIAALVKVSEGDLRKAITFLQSAARLNVDKEISEKAIVEIAGVSPPSREPLLELPGGASSPQHTSTVGQSRLLLKI